MLEPAWKRLVENLKEDGFESKYLDRLYERIAPPALLARAGYEALQREIIEEMAYALRRAEDKVNFALLEVEVVAAAIRENTDPSRRCELVVEYERKRDEAIRARWEFMVHRESIGLIEHDVVETLFPIPPSIARRGTEK